MMEPPSEFAMASAPEGIGESLWEEVALPELMEAAAGAAFPFGVGHAVRVVVNHDGQADFLLEDLFESDRLPAADVG